MNAPSALSKISFTPLRLFCLRGRAQSSTSTWVISVARTTSPMRIWSARRARRTPPLRPRTASINPSRANRLTILNTFCWVICSRSDSSATLINRSSAPAQSIRIRIACPVDLVRRIVVRAPWCASGPKLAHLGKNCEAFDNEPSTGPWPRGGPLAPSGPQPRHFPWRKPGPGRPSAQTGRPSRERPLFGEDQLAVGRDSQAVILAVVFEDHLARPLQQLANLDTLGPGAARRPLDRWGTLRILLADHVRTPPIRGPAQCRGRRPFLD